MKEEKPWFVYILECWDESLYTGITNDIEKRMTAHRSGNGSRYVKRKRFKRLLHTIRAIDKIDAAKMEYRIKQLERNDKIIFFLRHPDLDFSVTNNK